MHKKSMHVAWLPLWLVPTLALLVGACGKLYSTSDGGNHWSLTSSTVYHLNALSFTDPRNGWGVTSNQLLQTTDGGKTWQQVSYTIQ